MPCLCTRRRRARRLLEEIDFEAPHICDVRSLESLRSHLKDWIAILGVKDPEIANGWRRSQG